MLSGFALESVLRIKRNLPITYSYNHAKGIMYSIVNYYLLYFYFFVMIYNILYYNPQWKYNNLLK